MLALPMMLGLVSCSVNDLLVVVVEDVTVETPDETEPTEDQMTTLVTANVPTAVLGSFDEGTTGAVG